MFYLNKGSKKYNKEEARQIRDYLYFLGSLELENNDNKN
jgi:hypothetical protein